MKRALTALLLTICMALYSCVSAEGLLPSLTDTIGKPMPSLGEALGRYPDEEIPNADGSNTEVFHGITESDFNTFSVYLSEQGATLADYQAAGTTFSASIQVEGKMISFTYDTQTLEATVTYPGGTYDEWLDYAKTQFASVVQMVNEGKPEEAYALLLTIPGYERYAPAAALLSDSPELAAAAARAARMAPFKTVGSYVTFGTYPQTSGGTDSTPIEWLVLDYDAANNRALLISRYGLDAKPYNEKYVDITWEKCTLRTWLNQDFLNAAFSQAEQSAILLTNVDNSKSQASNRWGDTNGGNNTQDKFFLLSYAEANEYLGLTWEYSNNMKSRTSPTAYALQAGARPNDSYKTAEGTAACWWWLRSPCYNPCRAACVGSDGTLHDMDVFWDTGCVRPAFWINLESDIF